MRKLERAGAKNPVMLLGEEKSRIQVDNRMPIFDRASTLIYYTRSCARAKD